MEQPGTQLLEDKGAAVPTSRFRLRSRLGAFSIHLLISLAIFVVLMYLILAYWYTGPYFSYDGGWRGTFIVIAVDLVLGPVLTLIVFDPRKSLGKIRFDLAVIGLIQFAALAWGCYAVESQRPVAVSYFNGAFNPVVAQVVRDQNQSIESLSGLHSQFPPLVYVEIPGDEAGIERMNAYWEQSGHSPQNQVALFKPLRPHLDEIARRQPPVDRIANSNEAFREELAAFRKTHGEKSQQYLYVPFNGRYGVVLFVIDSEGRLVDWLSEAFSRIL